MKEEGRVNSEQIFFLVLNFLLASAFIMIPSTVTGKAGKDGWAAILIATGAGSLLSMLYTALCIRFSGRTIIQFAQEIMGKIPGKILGIIFVWFALHLGALVLRNFGDFMVISLMPSTPLIVFNAVVMLIAVMAVYRGIEVLCHFNLMLVPVILSSMAVIIIFSFTIHDFDAANLLPLFESGFSRVLKTSLIPLTFPFGESVLFLMIFPCMSVPRDTKKIMVGAILAAALIMAVITAETVAVFGSNAKNLMYSTHSMIRCIELAQIFERTDAITIVIWILSGVIKISVCFYAFVKGCAQLFALKDYRPIVVPSGIIMTALSILVYENVIEQTEFASKIWPLYSLVFELLLPLMLITFDSVKKVF
ncbi:MAG TPA: endospore germination permease [Thermoanaerobacterales bacterium]|nr:endospore germination permease [Thermoanaerobacterales bacterium]